MDDQFEFVVAINHVHAYDPKDPPETLSVL